MYRCGVCGTEIDSEPDNKTCFDPPKNLSDYFFCSKACARTHYLAIQIAVSIEANFRVVEKSL